MIRVLLVEDSVVQLEILRRVLSADGTFTIVGEARNGREAVRLADEVRPDVVLMDVHMPDMNGVEATREIMRRCPVPIVIASATLKKHDIDMGLEALRAGAISVMAKPEGAVLLHLDKISAPLCEAILAASKVKLLRRGQGPGVRGQESGVRRLTPDPSPLTPGIEVIGICASTGGPSVLIEILAALPRPFSIPILLVQHITQGFEESFAKWLSDKTGQSVGLAVTGHRLGAGIWMAPTGKHLVLRTAKLLDLPDQQPGDIHCPSGNPLFASLAKHYGSRAAGILLTGMGDDGAKGLLAIKNAHGTTIIQDEASSFIWGMPKAGKDLQAAKYELSPHEIALLMTEMGMTR
jgi:two-component system, chemotaxis family, protein-glutamate methylesterase/glutaminase